MGCCSCKRRQGVTQIPFPSTDLPSSLTHPRRLTSSSGFGGGGGRVDLSILRSRAFFFPAFDLAFFPMVADLFLRSLPLYYYEAVPKIQRSEQETACHRSVHEAATEARREKQASGRGGSCVTKSKPRTQRSVSFHVESNLGSGQTL